MTGKIFINYRRQDSAASAGRIYDRLKTTFGAAGLFMDVDNIPAAVDFSDYINDKLAECDIVLVLIGKDWLDAREISPDSAGYDRRLDNPQDFVRIEIATALRRGIPVMPVLIDGAPMPNGMALPSDLRALARRNAARTTLRRKQQLNERRLMQEPLSQINPQIQC